MQVSLQCDPVSTSRPASRPALNFRLSRARFACQDGCNSCLSSARKQTCCSFSNSDLKNTDGDLEDYACLVQFSMPVGKVSRGFGHNRKPSSTRSIRVSASSKPYVGSLVANDLKFAIVIARFNDLVTKLLLEGALEAFDRHGGDRDVVDVAWVPGSFELPILAKAMAKSGKYDAVVAIGTVVRGSTTHYEAVANAAAGGLLGAGQDSGVPVIFGVLTTESMEQALDRAGGKTGNKGGEAAVTAIEMANLLKTLRKEGKAAQAW